MAFIIPSWILHLVIQLTTTQFHLDVSDSRQSIGILQSEFIYLPLSWYPSSSTGNTRSQVITQIFLQPNIFDRSSPIDSLINTAMTFTFPHYPGPFHSHVSRRFLKKPLKLIVRPPGLTLEHSSSLLAPATPLSQCIPVQTSGTLYYPGLHFSLLCSQSNL